LAEHSVALLSIEEGVMSAIRIIAYIAAAILIFFGVLFIWATFSPQGNLGWLLIGVISVLIGFGLIWFAQRRKAAEEQEKNITYKVDLSGDIKLESLKCKACGGPLTPDNVKMVAGAPVVTCPYCGVSYQLTEEPKW
jgi:predicted membrane protein